MSNLYIEYKIKNKNIEDYELMFKSIFKNSLDILNIKYSVEVSLFFVSSEESLKLNSEYRNKNYIADVISFPAEVSSEIVDLIGYRELGDIFICFEEADKKAKQYNHSLKEELAWLFTHGLLHNLGFDHEISEEDEKEMFELTDKILERENIKYIIYNV